MDTKTILTSAITAIVVVVIGFVLVGGNQGVGAGSRFPNGLSADGTSPAAGEIRGTSFQLENGSATTSLIVDKMCMTVTQSDGGTSYVYINALGSLATTSTSCL